MAVSLRAPTGKMSAGEFRSARLRLGLSQQSAAELLEVHVMTVSRWERGHTPVSQVASLAMRYLLGQADGAGRRARLGKG